MQMMRAVTLKGFGGADMLQISQIPRVIINNANDVLIKVKAAGVNRADVAQRRGQYSAPEGVSEVLGLEVSGVVEQVGSDVTKFKAGDRVMALLSGGGYAQYAVANVGSVLAMPQGYSFTDAAAIPQCFLTAWQALRFHANVQPGQRVLIHAGASGVGVAAAQLVEKFFKGTAVTTSSTAKVDACKNFASVTVDRTPDEQGLCFAPKVRSLLGEEAIDVVLDPVFGGSYLRENASLLAKDGQIVVLAFLGGAQVQLNAIPLFRQRASVTFSTLRSRSDEYKSRLTTSFENEVLPYMKEREIVPVVNKIFSLEDVAVAHSRMEDGTLWGKSVLKVQHDD